MNTSDSSGITNKITICEKFICVVCGYILKKQMIVDIRNDNIRKTHEEKSGVLKAEKVESVRDELYKQKGQWK
jgi:hypothetical protein